MIYVNEKQLLQVEYLIEQSSRGHHVLFDLETIRSVLGSRKANLKKQLSEVTALTPQMTEEQMLKSSSPDSEDGEDVTIEKHLENLILQPSLEEKKGYLQNLPSEVFERLLKTYFAIVENNIVQGAEYQQ